jgi:signal transduction histidine kinase
MAVPLRLLIVEDREDDAELLIAELRRAGYDPQWKRIQTPEEFTAALADEPEIIVCDYSLPLMTAPDALTILRKRDCDIPLIVVSGVMDEDTCVTSLRLGAVDYLLKDRLVRLGPSIEHALNARQLAANELQARRERRETADILNAVVNHAPAAICVRDSFGSPLLSNLEYQRLGLPVTDVAGPLTSRAAMESEETFMVDGESRTYLCVRYPVIDADERPFAEGAIYMDITRQKRVEHELRELDRLKGEFVATVSHELRTPLTSISGYAEMLMGDPRVALSKSADRTDEHRMIEVIDRNSKRLLGLVDDLLTLSRVDSGVLGPGDDPVDVGELIASATAVLGPGAQAAGVTLETDVPDPAPAVRGDRGQLERAIINLVSNAIKFSGRGAQVTVRVTAGEQSDEVQIQVIDTGMGIAADELPQLFTRFFRTSEARRRAIQGTGLGLAVVREIVERHHGSVSVQSVPGEGTTMTVCLPQRQPALSG